MKRREFLRKVGGALAASAVPGSAFAAPAVPGGAFAASAAPRPSFGLGKAGKAPPPNILFIVVDDMGYADLGCYGSKRIKTPNVDRLAAEGMRFTDAYSGCTVCAPARSVLMTGVHMGHTSVRGNSGGIPLKDDDVTVAQVLKRAGYACGGSGKWGLGDVETPGVPERHGFDVFFGYYHQVHAHDYYPEYLWRNSTKVPLPGNASGGRRQYSHHLIFEETKRFIRENANRPFFCYAPWTPPHGHYVIPQDDPAWQVYADKPWPEQAKVVAAMDTMIDRHVGELCKLLEELGIAERTIVFFTSDNGAAIRFDGVLDSCGPLRGFKRSLYEGGIRVPMIVRWPGRIRPGTVSGLPWSFADVMPTLAELARLEAPEGIDGISVVPALIGEETAGRKQKEHEFLYWEYGGGKRGPAQAIRMGRWKAVRPKPGAALELYDLTEDIGEANNVAEKHPDVIERISKRLKACRTDPRPQIEPKKPKGKRYR